MTHKTDYILRITKMGDVHVVEAPEYSIVRQGDDVATVVEAVRNEIEKIVGEYKKAGLELPTSAVEKSKKNSPASMRLAITAAIVLMGLVAVGALAEAGYNALMARVQAPVANIMKIADSGELARNLSNGVGVVARTLESITPERRQELVDNLRRIAVSLEPYAAQLRPLLVPVESNGMASDAADGDEVQ